MFDKFGRPLRSIRISVTDDCNLNCFYCHREGCVAGGRLMTAREIGALAEVAAEFGMRSVKLTGGEPLSRGDIADIVKRIAGVGVKEISMTTNGVLLAGLAKRLSDAGLSRVNISLDTLDPKIYAKLTGKPVLDKALEGVDAAIEAGLKPVKLNMVMLAGINDGEVERMLKFASSHGTILQLIELLPQGEDQARYHYDLTRIEGEFQKRATAVKVRSSLHARKKYILPDGEVEIVKPMHNSQFCMHCTRLRLTSDGYLKPCLMRNDNLVDALSPLRDGNLDGVRQAFVGAIGGREPYFRGTGPGGSNRGV